LAGGGTAAEFGEDNKSKLGRAVLHGQERRTGEKEN